MFPLELAKLKRFMLSFKVFTMNVVVMVLKFLFSSLTFKY
jgi:hypothetical protein